MKRDIFGNLFSKVLSAKFLFKGLIVYSLKQGLSKLEKMEFSFKNNKINIKKPYVIAAFQTSSINPVGLYHKTFRAFLFVYYIGNVLNKQHDADKREISHSGFVDRQILILDSSKETAVEKDFRLFIEIFNILGNHYGLIMEFINFGIPNDSIYEHRSLDDQQPKIYVKRLCVSAETNDKAEYNDDWVEELLIHEKHHFKIIPKNRRSKSMTVGTFNGTTSGKIQQRRLENMLPKINNPLNRALIETRKKYEQKHSESNFESTTNLQTQKMLDFMTNKESSEKKEEELDKVISEKDKCHRPSDQIKRGFNNQIKNAEDKRIIKAMYDDQIKRLKLKFQNKEKEYKKIIQEHINDKKELKKIIQEHIDDKKEFKKIIEDFRIDKADWKRRYDEEQQRYIDLKNRLIEANSENIRLKIEKEQVHKNCVKKLQKIKIKHKKIEERQNNKIKELTEENENLKQQINELKKKLEEHNKKNQKNSIGEGNVDKEDKDSK